MDLALLLFYIACMGISTTVSVYTRNGVITNSTWNWVGWSVASTFAFILALQQYHETKTDTPSYMRLSAYVEECHNQTHKAQIISMQVSEKYTACLNDRSDFLTKMEQPNEQPTQLEQKTQSQP